MKKLKPIKSAKKPLKKAVKQEFTFPKSGFYWQGIVDYDNNNSGCNGCENQYCNCSTVRPVFNYVNYDSIYNEIIKSNSYEIKINSIKKYCLDRCIRKLITESDVHLSAARGYYGEEVHVSVPEGNKKLEDLVQYLNTHTETECIEHSLILEYGFVLPEIKDKAWALGAIETNLIHAQNYKHVSQEIVKQYLAKDNIVLGIKQNNALRLIDGYHRYTANSRNKKETTRIIYCE